MKQFGIALALGLVGLVLILFLLNWFEPGQAELRAQKTELAEQHSRLLAPLWLAVKRVLVAALGVSGASLALLLAVAAVTAIFSTPNFVRLTWLRSWQVKADPRTALYAALAEPDGRGHIRVVPPVNEAGAQKIAALTAPLKPDVRLQGSAARAALRPTDDQYMLPEPEATIPDYPPDQVITPDPQNRPDTLVVGQKGAGKTNTLRYLIDAYRRAMPDADFLVLSPVASNWAGLLPVISDTEDIRQAVLALRAELTARDQTLAAAGVRDIHRAGADLRRVVVVVDEAETVADAIKLVNQAKYREFTGTLRIVINTARNFGLCIIFGTQTARADVLDPAFMRNASTLLMMRMDAATAARFAEYDRKIVDGLPTLARGRAYCPQAGGYVQFPLVETIRKPRISTIYQPSAQLPAGSAGAASHPLSLPADALADGVGADDEPDSPGVVVVNPGDYSDYSSPTVVAAGGGPPRNGGEHDYSSPTVVAATVDDLTAAQRVARIPKDRPPTRDSEQETIYALWLAARRNAAEIERQVYGYDGGVAHWYVVEAINKALARRGQPARYKERPN